MDPALRDELARAFASALPTADGRIIELRAEMETPSRCC